MQVGTGVWGPHSSPGAYITEPESCVWGGDRAHWSGQGLRGTVLGVCQPLPQAHLRVANTQTQCHGWGAQNSLIWLVVGLRDGDWVTWFGVCSMDQFLCGWAQEGRPCRLFLGQTLYPMGWGAVRVGWRGRGRGVGWMYGGGVQSWQSPKSGMLACTRPNKVFKIISGQNSAFPFPLLIHCTPCRMVTPLIVQYLGNFWKTMTVHISIQIMTG